jgi:beta-fructofuranosidase
MSQDPHRPTYHHLPEEGLLWDPCAAVYRGGRYHLFYLHDSWAAAGPSKRSDGYNYKAWAHVSSEDLVHWRRHPDAIARGQTGNLFDWNGTPAIVFPHPDGGGASCFASNPEGDLERWQFDPAGAALRHPVQGNSLYPSSNDVTAWQEDEWCYVLTGTRDQQHGGDAQHLFRSRNPLAGAARHGDSAEWEYVHQFYRSRREWTDAADDCACPEFFRIGEGEAAKWMLLHFCHNAPGGSRYYLGSYRDHRFHPECFERINWPGGNLHAPRAMLDGAGRRIMFANVNERRPPDELVAAGWSGCISLPVALTLDPDAARVRFAPVDELQALRHEPREWTDLTLAATGPSGEVEVALPGADGDALEIELQIEAGGAATCGVSVRCSPDGAEETAIALNSAERTVEIEFGKANLRRDLAFARWDAKLDRPVQSAPLEFDPAQPATLRIFVDHSVVEVFAGAGAEASQFERYLVQRIYPTRRDALGLKLFSRGGSALARRVRTWRMHPA